MSGAWLNFAVTDDPNGQGVPEWPPYDDATRPYMEFGPRSGVRHDLLPDQMVFFDRYTAARLRTP